MRPLSSHTPTKAGFSKLDFDPFLISWLAPLCGVQPAHLYMTSLVGTVLELEPQGELGKCISYPEGNMYVRLCMSEYSFANSKVWHQCKVN